MSSLQHTDPAVYKILCSEMKRQAEGIELIPSENYVSPAVLEAMGSIFTNKYSEGYPGKRYYGGQTFTDQIELLAIERAKKLFKAEHVNVQPLSGAPMNIAVYMGLLQPGDTILGMDLSHGGHLTHGSPVTHMAKLYKFVRYKTDPENNGKMDFDAMLETAKQEKPKIILAGFTSYPRDLDYENFKRVADTVGAITMADVAHIGGLIAGGVLKNPFDYGFDIVTTTTHKTLRGPRGGIILCREKFAKIIDRSVFPGLQGGPHMNQIAALAVALGEAMRPDFKKYAEQVLKNAHELAINLMKLGAKLVTNGTSNHLLVMDTMRSFDLPGKIAEHLLDEVGITVNKQIIPDDPRAALDPSGIRFGSPAATTRGMKEEEMQKIAGWMMQAIHNHNQSEELSKIKREVTQLCLKFPVPGIRL